MDVFWDIEGAETEFRRAERVQSPAHAIRNAPRHKALVVVERLLRRKPTGAERAAGGVRVGAGDEHVGGRNAGGLLDEAAGLGAYRSVEAEQVADHEREARTPVVEDEAASVQLVVDVLRGKGGEAADDRRAKWRREVARGGPGAESRGRGGGGKAAAGRGEDAGQEDEGEGHKRGPSILAARRPGGEGKAGGGAGRTAPAPLRTARPSRPP